MDDKKLLKELDKIKADYDTKPVDKDLLAMIFQSFGGAIYINEKQEIAIGFYPESKALVFVFFEFKNNKLKKTDRRAIYVTEGISKELTFGEREIPHPLGVGMKANKQPKLYI